MSIVNNFEAYKDVKPILAGDATIGQFYLTPGLFFKLKILKKFGEGTSTSSVLVEYEGRKVGTVTITANTELLPFNEEFHKKTLKLTDPTTKTKETSMPEQDLSSVQTNIGATQTDATQTVGANVPEAAASKTKKEKKEKAEKSGVKMSDIIKPLLLDGTTAEKIADAVIAVMPEKAAEKAELVKQIAGPRKFNLIRELTKAGKPIPEALQKKEAPAATTVANPDTVQATQPQ